MEKCHVKVTQKLADWLVEHGCCLPCAPQADPETIKNVYGRAAADAMADGVLSPDQYRELVSKEPDMPTTPTPDTLFAQKGGSIRAKAPSEMYSTKRYTARHTKTGQEVVDPVHGCVCETIDDASNAKYGALLKHLARKAGIWDGFLNEHEDNLLTELCVESPWAGRVNGEYEVHIKGGRGVKALLDDAISGGIQIVPLEFDRDVVTFPLLNGELFPLVDLKEVPRGRRIEGASISTPTMTWGGGDGTEIALFDTSDIVAQLDTTIFTIDGALEVGRDFLSDSAANVGETLTRLVGERLTTELDKVIASGNGTTQPEGLFTATGVGTATTENAAAGPPTLADYTELMFAIAKQYRTPTNRCVFVSNDTTYQRSRSIKVDASGSDTDQRPVLADVNSFNNYSTMGWPHKIQNDLANTVAAFVAMNRYRMYRRLGLDIRFETGGKELARKNMALLVYRARFGGRLMDANAMAKWTNGQT